MTLRVVMAALVLIGAAFQFQGPMILGADAWTSSATFRGFFPPENGLRWSGERGTIVFPDPGSGVPVRVEVLLSGWRPPGIESPNVAITAFGRTVTSRLPAGASVVSIETTTAGWWRSDLEIDLRSDVFDPGRGDPRRLGVRVEEARLIPLSPGLRVPSFGAILGAALSALLVAFVLRRAGMAVPSSERAALAVVAGIALACAFARSGIAIALPLFTLGLLAVSGLAALMPRSTRKTGEVVGAAAHAFAAGLLRLKDPHLLTLAATVVVLVTAAHRTPGRIDIDLGSGREARVARGFGSFVGKGGATARWAPRGASLDLSDFGGGASWKVEVRAALDGAPRDVEVLGTGEREIALALQESTWTEGAMSAPSPFGWKSGLVLSVPGGSDRLRIDRVSIERGAAVPSIRVLLLVFLGGLIGLLGAGVVGLSVRVGRTAAGLVVAGSAMAMATQPVAAIPFVFQFTAILAAALFLAALLKGAATVFDADERFMPHSAAIGASICGWVAWLVAAAFPFYRGGHFVFHSSIAEEIWKGRFLIYYLPFPGSMLSEQAQWGKIVMPHPALYQTLVSPLAALPRPWFYFAEKVLLALFFASLVLVASAVAQRVWGRRAATFAAVLFVALVPGFQLLGLGHLMTILGVWASSLALPWLIVKADELGRFKTWLATAWLFTFCFLSYTAALLFTGAVLVGLILVSARANLARARALFAMLLAACTFAFLLYYVHWTLPFLMQSVPRILGGAGLGSAAAEATPILARLSLEPGKLSYSHGSMLIPIAGAFGLPAMCNVSLATNHSGQRRSIREWGSRTCARYSGERT